MTRGRRADASIGVAAGRRPRALIAALVLLGMVFLVAMSNNARDEALDGERHADDVTLLTRNLDASIARSEAAPRPLRARRRRKTSGNVYYSQWRSPAGRSTSSSELLRDEPSQVERLKRLQSLYVQRGAELALAASATAAGAAPAARAIIYAALRTNRTVPALRRKLRGDRRRRARSL